MKTTDNAADIHESFRELTAEELDRSVGGSLARAIRDGVWAGIAKTFTNRHGCIKGTGPGCY